ncbi:uncharacterized protein EV422DRAFT_523138 [Fimicolochytrium jonesii]|uniref:uncharacterized protein n=1 Tax=Fimicolochytrium jonesii TaxID=1396493 RepID=UPI0022FE065E|nr:uncharacterized protein EV422DRAFT_523138 [Fimicolochytrium jonesii]KAI8823038.1 hypothetical protein EV422DRAFT_523138 [Fimicolochytrium jonesii]
MPAQTGVDSAADGALEWALICGEVTQANESVPAIELLDHLKTGSYVEVLKSATAVSLFGTDSKAEQDISDSPDFGLHLRQRTEAFLAPDNAPEKQLQVLAVGVACLYAFLQHGWTGPTLAIDAAELLPESFRTHRDVISKRALSLLAEDGEEAYSLTTSPLFLVLAKALLVTNIDLLSALHSVDWWAARVLFVQQKLLDEPADTLRTGIYEALERQGETLKKSQHSRDLMARHSLEFGLAHHYYGEDSKAVPFFNSAQEASGFKWTLTGALGRRTKFQTFDTSQLVIMAESAGETAAAGADDEGAASKPRQLDLNDDTLLETIAFTDIKEGGDEQRQAKGSLKPIDQCILLAFCLNVKNLNPADGLTTEEMLPYVRRVLENPNNWMVHTMGLLLRSRLESNKSRTVERAALQLQALVDQIKLEEPSAAERMLHIFSIELPPKWELERELGERFVSIGVTRSALEIFERLEMWEDVISCYQLLEQPQKAEAVIHEQLKVHPRSPKLHCILGDITQDPAHFELAWQLSDGRFARAMRSLGAYHYKRGEFEKSIECYHRALAINSLFENSWFVMGCAAMRIEDFDQAVRAFSRVTTLNHENGEAWTNLASAYIRQKKKREAWRALKEALKQQYDNAKIWENYMFTSVDLGEFQEAMHAMERVLEHTWDKKQADNQPSPVDVQVLEILVEAVTSPTLLDAQGQPASKHAPKVATLLTRLTSKIAANPRLFACAAIFFAATGSYRKALDFRLKAYRALLHHPRLVDDEKIFQSTAKRAVELVDAYVALGPLVEKRRMAGVTLVEGESEEEAEVVEEEGEVVCKDWAYQAKMVLKTLVGRTKANFEDTPAHDSLKEKLQEVTELGRA